MNRSITRGANMNHVRRVAIMIALCLTTNMCSVAWGINILFLPGDAFFPTELTTNDLAKLKADADEPPIFVYSNFSGGGYLAGYAGYRNAKIPGVDESFLDNLKKAYARIRRSQNRLLAEERDEIDKEKIVLRELNGMRVLFYPASFDLTKFKIGLPYNENWVNETVKFGYDPRTIQYGMLVDHPSAFMHCWRDATVVEPLDAELPDVELKPGPPTHDPVTIKVPIKAIVLDSEPLEVYFDYLQHFPAVMVVDSSGITELMYDRERNEWTETKIDE